MCLLPGAERTSRESGPEALPTTNNHVSGLEVNPHPGEASAALSPMEDKAFRQARPGFLTNQQWVMSAALEVICYRSNRS